MAQLALDPIKKHAFHSAGRKAGGKAGGKAGRKADDALGEREQTHEAEGIGVAVSCSTLVIC